MRMTMTTAMIGHGMCSRVLVPCRVPPVTGHVRVRELSVFLFLSFLFLLLVIGFLSCHDDDGEGAGMGMSRGGGEREERSWRRYIHNCSDTVCTRVDWSNTISWNNPSPLHRSSHVQGVGQV